jgi:hypothetical protein
MNDITFASVEINPDHSDRPSPASQPAEFMDWAELWEEPLWVGWVLVNRPGKDGEPHDTKQPIKPHNRGAGFLASADDPATWGTSTQVERLVTAGSVEGAGFVLTALPDGTHAIGFDCDGCRHKDGTLEPWASKFLDLMTYGEISPSQEGAKFFLRVTTDDLKQIRALLELSESRWGCSWKQSLTGPADIAKAPKVEFHLGHRYYAVTGNTLHPALPNALRLVPFVELAPLIR